jgi:hypothetical protein
MIYEEQYCANCIHANDECGCPIWTLHMLYNYDQCRKGKTGQTIKTVLGMLIPETKDGIGAEQCRMFRAKADSEAEEAEQRRLAEQPARYEAAMRELTALKNRLSA